MYLRSSGSRRGSCSTAASADEVTAALAARLLHPGGVEILKKPKPAPKPKITAIVAAGPNATGAVTVTGKTYAKAKVKVDVGANGSIDQTVKANAKGVYQVSFTVGFGGTQVKLSATAPGHKATATTLMVNRPDTVPPAITLGAPVPGPLTRSQVTITGTVSDVGTGVAALVADVDGQSSPVSFDASGSFSYTTTLSLSGSADGPNTVQFVATDRAGNTTHSATETFKLDTRPPVISVSAPANGALETSNVSVSGRVSDAVSGPAALTAALDGGSPQPVPLLADGSFASHPPEGRRLERRPAHG